MVRTGDRETEMEAEANEIYHHQALYIALGIILIIGGILSLGSVVFISFASILFFGWLLLIAGIVQVFASFFTGKWSSFFLFLFTGGLSFIFGVLIISNPVVSIGTLTLLLSLILLVGGIFRMVTAAVMQFPGRGWTFIYGMITTFLGILIWRQWPASSLWVIGLFIGIELIASGFATVMTVFESRKLTYQYSKK
ncbi:hypothetical protein HGA88_03605 [Candidatus Roizmanbacteria bacterium]|nr:hypothetical protein [Candidatus Roizmanbacteria bacterium]